MATQDDVNKAQKEGIKEGIGKGYDLARMELACELCENFGLFLEGTNKLNFDRLVIIKNLLNEHDNPVYVLHSPSPKPSVYEVINRIVKETVDERITQLEVLKLISPKETTPTVIEEPLPAPVEEATDNDLILELKESIEDDEGQEENDDVVTTSLGTFNNKSLPEEANIEASALNTSTQLESTQVKVNLQAPVDKISNRGRRPSSNKK